MSKFRYEKERGVREGGQGGRKGGEGGVGWQGRGPLAGWDGTRAADVLTVRPLNARAAACVCVLALLEVGAEGSEEREELTWGR